MNNTQRVGDFVEQINKQTLFQPRFEAFGQLVEDLGYEGVLYTYIPSLLLEPNMPVTPVFATSDGYSSAFIDHYFEAGLHQEDYTIRKIRQGNLRILDWWQDYAEGQLSADETDVIKTARCDYSITHGMTLPLMAEARGIAGVSVISSEGDSRYSKLKQQSLETLQLCSRVFHAFILADKQQRQQFMPFIDMLNEKERTVLRFLVTGKAIKRIEDDTGISYHYAVKHLLPGMRKKLGNLSKDRLLYYAGLHELEDFC